MLIDGHNVEIEEIAHAVGIAYAIANINGDVVFDEKTISNMVSDYLHTFNLVINMNEGFLIGLSE